MIQLISAKDENNILIFFLKTDEYKKYNYSFLYFSIYTIYNIFNPNRNNVFPLSLQDIKRMTHGTNVIIECSSIKELLDIIIEKYPEELI